MSDTRHTYQKQVMLPNNLNATYNMVASPNKIPNIDKQKVYSDNNVNASMFRA
jgi:hypothetical protein